MDTNAPKPRRFSLHIAVLYAVIVVLALALASMMRENLRLSDQLFSVRAAPYNIRDALRTYRSSQDKDLLERRRTSRAMYSAKRQPTTKRGLENYFKWYDYHAGRLLSAS